MIAFWRFDRLLRESTSLLLVRPAPAVTCISTFQGKDYHQGCPPRSGIRCCTRFVTQDNQLCWWVYCGSLPISGRRLPCHGRVTVDHQVHSFPGMPFSSMKTSPWTCSGKPHLEENKIQEFTRKKRKVKENVGKGFLPERAETPRMMITVRIGTISIE
jgi:hypothetical protein